MFQKQKVSLRTCRASAYSVKKIESILSEFSVRGDFGLSSDEAQRRLEKFGLNALSEKRETNVLFEYLSYFKSPLVVILLIASGISAFFGEMRNAVVIWIMVLMSVTLDFFEEHSAGNAAKALQNRLTLTSKVFRDGKIIDVPVPLIVPGDVLSLSAGNLIPADARILSADDCFVNQSALTGESMPVEKRGGEVGGSLTEVSGLSNILFLGTSVVSGTAIAMVVCTGKDTEYGHIASTLVSKEEKSEFELGIVSFGYFIMKAILFLVLLIFLLNTLMNHNVLESFMFAIAIAVGVTPELLPMILSITMSRGSIRMSKKGVIVKKLSAIPSFGSMDILCMDKTGTITEDRIEVVAHTDAFGNVSKSVLEDACINSHFQSGMNNPLDEALLKKGKCSFAELVKTEEIPFDFQRKMVSVAFRRKGEQFLVTKGAPEEVWNRCVSACESGACILFDTEARKRALAYYESLSRQGYRVLAVARKSIVDVKAEYTTEDEKDLELLGYVSFLDPAKKGVKTILKNLRDMGVEMKIITGDNEFVTEKICGEIGLPLKGILLGKDLAKLSDRSLALRVREITIFARCSPDQKNRIISALRKAGHVVGYMGDGINDAPSLRAADVGISVSNAVDVARESADMVLTQKSLRILREGILEGRKTFGNTMKYILMGLSSNFGNMFSMLGAVFFLPFLPMLPIQIILNNLLYDCSQVTIPTDHVDQGWLERPHRWNLGYIKKFMLNIGPVSSVFDIATFLVLFYGFHASQSIFQTGWFIESLATQTLVIHIIRTQKIPFIQSRSSLPLLVSTFSIVVLGWLIPFTPVGAYFGFAPLPWQIMLAIVGLVLTYFLCVELLKRRFFRREGFMAGA